MDSYSFQSVEISASLLPLLADFTCGVGMMDDILHSQGLLAELHTDNPVAYCVYNECHVLVGFCIWGTIDQPIDFSGSCELIPMIDVACLAVHKDYQYRGIGTAILNVVCEKSSNAVPSAKFIHVDALDCDDGSYSAVPFYLKYGFEYYSRAGEDVARMLYRLRSV